MLETAEHTETSEGHTTPPVPLEHLSSKEMQHGIAPSGPGRQWEGGRRTIEFDGMPPGSFEQHGISTCIGGLDTEENRTPRRAVQESGV